MNKNQTKDNMNEEEIKIDDDVEFEDLNEDGEVSQRDKIKKLQEKIKILTKEKEEYLNGWQRSQADFANREREIAKEKSEAGKYAIKNFILGLMPILDTYDAARANKTAWESVDANWRAGIEYIFSTFENKLKEEGLEAFANVGDSYDVSLHEAVEAVNTEDESQDGKLSQVLARGYKLNGNVIREAKAKVYKFTK